LTGVLPPAAFVSKPTVSVMQFLARFRVALGWVSGPYRYVAHPLYVGSSIMGVGLGVASRNPVAAALVIIYLIVTLNAAIKSEEAFLRRMFGDQYDLYRHWGRENGAARGDRPFSMAQVVANREYRALLGLIGAMLLLALKATYNASFGG
jgi:hypothetical protein